MSEEGHKHKWTASFAAEFDFDGTPYVAVRFGCSVDDCEESKIIVAEQVEL